MERFIPVECFGKKVIPSEVFFSRFYRNSRKILYHLSTITSARLNFREDSNAQDGGFELSFGRRYCVLVLLS